MCVPHDTAILPGSAGEPPASRRILQLTDPHLFDDPAGRLLGLTTRRTFEAVLELALARSGAADPLLLTGDLVHGGTPAGYRTLRRILEATGRCWHAIPGNHDRSRPLADVLGAAACIALERRWLDGWQLILADTSHPGEDGGRLAPARLAQLGAWLADAVAPTLIFTHHPPLAVGSAWLDTMRIDTGAALLALCDRAPAVRGLICGHIHQAFTKRRAGYQILGAPSTCIQFRPRRQRFALDDRLPGYRELRLDPDGRLSSRIVRLGQHDERPDREGMGY